MQHGDEQHDARARELCRRFGLFYLSLYARAVAGGPGAESLNWGKAAALKQYEAGYLTLMVVLDGLGVADAEVLSRAITDESMRLDIDFKDINLAPLPTVTEFAKSALLTGVQPAYAAGQETLGSVHTKDLDIIEALSEAKPGDIRIWKLPEPDTVYHLKQDSETIVQRVKGTLQSVASRIVKVAHAVPSERRLKVVLCTDHGRLLAVSRRTQEVPGLMTAHGRAAWGQHGRAESPDGFAVEQDIVYLHPARLGLAEPCAIVLSDDSFLTSDGKTGSEAFPHGGLYPEEVLIPWITLTRDRNPLSLQPTLEGQGNAGASGTLVLRVYNPSDLPIRLVRLEVSVGDLRIELNRTVGPMGEQTVEKDWAPWPYKRDLDNLQATLSYSLPAGEERVVVFKPSLRSEELYSTEGDDILGELDF